jgi:NADH:ubiquinone oxidoreductase subunit H
MDALKFLDPTIQFVLFSAVKILIAFGVVMTFVAYAVLVERKVSAWIQDRVGPNRATPFFARYIPILGPALVRLGIFQPMADGLKFLLKEDFTPAHARAVYFWLAPAISVIPALMTIAVIPFGSTLGNPANPMVIADLNVGILYTFGIVSLGVYGIVLAGYASNSKFPFLGGIRSSAQMISYEIAMGMSVISVFMVVGDLNLSRVVAYQEANLFQWMIWKQPVAFLVFLVGVRVRARGWLPHRVQLDEVCPLLPWGVRGDDRRLGDDGDSIPWGLGVSMGWRPGDRDPGRTGPHPLLRHQDGRFAALFHLDPLDASPVPV